jgi:hypothetical protein
MVESGMSPYVLKRVLDIVDEGCPTVLCENGKKMEILFINVWDLN